MEPIISIITTTHNIIEKGQADDFALQCKLLKMQSYKNIEHIVIDNASTDGTIDLLNDYKSRGHLTFYSEKDSNKFDGYNKGITKSKGQYLTFISCDDFFHDITALSDLVTVMEMNNADFAFSPSYCRHPKDIVFLYMPSMYNVFQVMPCPRQCMFYKKSALAFEKGFDTKFKYMADFDLIIRMVMKKHKGVFFERNYTTYKLGENLYQHAEWGDEEAKQIFIKNYKDMTKLSDELLEDMVKRSAFPQDLLDKLVTKFPESDRILFYDRCEQMRGMRTEASKHINGGQ